MSKQGNKLLAYFLIPVVLLFLLFLHQSSFAPVKLKVANILSWPVRIISIPLYELKKIVFYHRTFNEYIRLRKESDMLRSRLVGLEEVLQENSRLEKLLSFKRRLVFSAVAAAVIGRDYSNWDASVIIDKGTEDGLIVGMPVVNSLGVVGKVVEVAKTTSKVLLVSDPQFSVAALVKRPRESGLLSGTLQGVCRLRHLSSDAQIQVGDKVITSKLSSSFPEGLLIGEVIEVQSEANNPIIHCVVQPAVSLSQLEEVLVVFN